MVQSPALWVPVIGAEYRTQTNVSRLPWVVPHTERVLAAGTFRTTPSPGLDGPLATDSSCGNTLLCTQGRERTNVCARQAQRIGKRIGKRRRIGKRIAGLWSLEVNWPDSRVHITLPNCPFIHRTKRKKKNHTDIQPTMYDLHDPFRVWLDSWFFLNIQHKPETQTLDMGEWFLFGVGGSECWVRECDIMIWFCLIILVLKFNQSHGF